MQARDFTERTRPAGAPQPGQFMQAGHARFVSQAFNFDVLTVRLLRGTASIWIGDPTCHLSDPWDLWECFGNRALPPYRMGLEEG